MLGALMMLGALVFLGCPLRALLRLAGGDLNGITALAGFLAGIGTGIVFLRNGFSLGRARTIAGPVAFAVCGLCRRRACGRAITAVGGASSARLRR